MIQLKKNIIRFLPLILILIGVALFFTLHLGRDEFSDWDECIYLRYGQEMMRSHNFLTNQWNGMLGFEKPPFYALLLQMPFLFGISTFTARIWSVLFTLIIVTVVYIFTEKYFSKKTAVLASLLLFTSQTFVSHVARVNTDIGYTAFIVLAFYFWIEAFKKPKLSYFVGLFFGLAVMIKGLSVSSFIIAFFISIFLPYKKEKLLSFIKLMIPFLIVILPWHMYEFVTYKYHFYQIYILENIIQRANNPLEFHFTGRLFYVKQLLHEFFPWIFVIFLLPFFYVWNIMKKISRKQIIKDIKKYEVIILVLLCIIVPFAVLTRSQTRLEWYAIPLFPFLTISLSYTVMLILDKKKGIISSVLYILILILILLDVTKTIANEVRPFDFHSGLSSRNQMFYDTRAFPEKSLNYMVPKSERVAEAILPKSMRTSTTFIYGGAPCSVYYSDKKMIIFYSEELFKNALKTKKGLFSTENGDKWILEGYPVKIMKENMDYTVFRLE